MYASVAAPALGRDQGSGVRAGVASGLTPAGTGCRRPCKQHCAHRGAAREICPAPAQRHWPAAGELGVLSAIGADPAPDAHRGSSRLAAARSATAAIAATRTMASVIFGVITFFITHFLSYGLRSPQSCLAVWTGLPAHAALCTATAGGVRLTDELSPARTPARTGRSPGQAFAPGPEIAPTEPGWPGTIRSAGHGSAPWPGPRPGPAGRPAFPPSRRAHAESSACRRGCASSPGQRPSREAGHGRCGLAWQALLRRR